MKTILMVLILLSLSCSKVDLMRDVPDCIESKIMDFTKSGTICSSGAEVTEYRFQDQTVYTFSQGNCGYDLQTGIYDSLCNELGGLGGFAGNTEINGENFDSNAVFIGKVWGN